MLAASQDFPCGNEHVTQTSVSMLLVMPDDIDAVVSQLQGTIEEVRRKDSLLPFPHDTFCVLGVVEINSPPPRGGVTGGLSPAQPRHALHEGDGKGA